MKQPHCNLLGIGDFLESVIFYPLSSTRTIVFEFDEEFSSEMRALSLSPRAKKFFAINARKKKEKIPSPFFFSLPAFTEKKNSQSSRGEEISVKITEGKSGDQRSERFVVEEKA